jgi:MFS family permease
MTVLLLASPLGIVIGYTVTYYMIQSHTWEFSFYIQAIALVPCIICFMVTPSRYIDIEQTTGYKNQCAQKVEDQMNNDIIRQEMNDQENDFMTYP